MVIKRILIAAGISAAFAGLLAACGGGFRGEPRAAWRGEAELACLRSGVIEGMPYIKQSREISGPGACGADYPIKVAAFASEFTASIGGGQGFAAAVKPEATLACPMVPALNRWMNEVVQPAAMEWFGQPVAELRTMGSYACRSRNNRSGAKLSEHAFANAIDIGGFKLADGTVVKVKGGWKGDLASQGFLKTAHQGACRYFKTILGPGSDSFHHDHFHLDLAQHGRRKSVVCRPRVAIPEKPDFYDPASRAASFGEGEEGFVKPSPGPKPMQDPAYEQEPEISGASEETSGFDLPQ
jgi:hypothetical protein